MDLLFPVSAEELRVRRTRFSEIQLHVSPVIAKQVTVLLPYKEPLVQLLIQEAKFGRNISAQMLLGKILAMYIISIEQKLPEASATVLIPLPLGAKRRKERGYNQVEEIIRCAMPYLKETERSITTDSKLLVRTRETAAQTSLGREDRLNAFKTIGPLHAAYLYIVVDDVLTTGATLSAAIEALRSGGAVQIQAIALAH